VLFVFVILLKDNYEISVNGKSERKGQHFFADLEVRI